MKRIYLYLFIFTCILFTACDKEDTTIYGGNTHLTFSTDISTDSLEISFYFYPGEETLEIPVPLSLQGMPFMEDTPVKLIVDTVSTAKETNYALPKNPVFHANVVADTLWMELKKTDELESKSYTLVLTLEATRDYQLGPKALRYNKTIFSAIPTRPEWWNNTITNVYLGKYSRKKFELFMQETGVGDITGLSASEIRALALKFKRYLKAQNPPIYDEDNEEDMTVTVIGE